MAATLPDDARASSTGRLMSTVLGSVLGSCLLEHGFQFKFPASREAVHDLCQPCMISQAQG